MLQRSVGRTEKPWAALDRQRLLAELAKADDNRDNALLREIPGPYSYRTSRLS